MDITREYIAKGPVQLPPGSESVTDADEELFVLYSELQSISKPSMEQPFRGLGYVDNRKDILEIKFELKNVISTDNAFTGRKKRQTKHKRTHTVDKTVDIEILQDKTALHSRKGDTGSVLWKASVDFAQLILQQCYSNAPQSLLPRDVLKTQHVLELGSGIGLLGIALSPLVKQYTATDIGPLIPLIRKNINLNFNNWPGIPAGEPGSNIAVETLDWQVLESTSPDQRSKLINLEPVDIILAVDCIYHPSLLPSFVGTIDHLSLPGRTAVLVVSELRSEDVMREFLERWLGKPGWEIWRLATELEKHYVVWLGWKT